MVTELIYHMVSSINMHYLQTNQMEQTKVFELRLRLRGWSPSVKFGKLNGLVWLMYKIYSGFNWLWNFLLIDLDLTNKVLVSPKS